MSDLLKEAKVSDSKDCPAASTKPIKQKIPTHNAQIGENLTIHRALPNRERRMVGAWCFFDHFGPLNLKTGELSIAPHPHMGLQTFTWVLHGEILHRDSLGSKQVIKPGEVNLMTAGFGISHSEESLPDSVLHGVQLWIALPDNIRNGEPEFAHYKDLPTREQGGFEITVVAGEFEGMKAPTKVFSLLMGIDLNAKKEATTTFTLNPKFEYGLMVLDKNMQVEDETIEPGTLLYLGCGRKELVITAPKDARIFMIGGEPFEEEVLLWWNFVARTREEMVQATHDWERHDRFGEVHGYKGGRLEPPTLGK